MVEQPKDKPSQAPVDPRQLDYEDRRREWAKVTGRPLPIDGGHRLGRGK